MNIRLSKNLKIGCAGASALVGLLAWYGAAAIDYGAQIYASMGAPALSKSNLTAGAGGGKLFEVRFDPVKFHGDVLARTVNDSGAFTPDELYPNPYQADPELAGTIKTFNGDWRAQATVDAQSNRTGGGASDNRVIITSGSDGTTMVGRIFNWDHVNGGLPNGTGSDENLKLLVDPDTWASDAANSDVDKSPVVNWTRGWDDSEGTGTTDLRAREHVLGNVVHVTPKYVGAPFKGYTWTGYNDFRSDNAGRVAMLYAGGSDAMLHGFEAGTGTAVFSYIPHALLGGLKDLTSQGYTETFGADGSPTVDDAYGAFPGCDSGPCWQTVLVAGLGVGGDVVFALNVTDPIGDIGAADTISRTVREAAAADKLFLWEFGHADLGQTTAQPIIARLGDGTWVAIFGSGLGADKAALFVVNIATGTLIGSGTPAPVVADSSTGNGLSSPAAWDDDFDGNIDYVYAGDLLGNLWRFDFTSASATNPPSVSFSGSPLVSVTDPDTTNALPITVKPVISTNSGGGLLVYFGTGTQGQSLGDTNGLFGIEDKGTAQGSNPALLVHTMQPIIYEHDPPDDPTLPTPPADKYRVIAATTEPNNPVGWKLQLPTGERILSNPILTNQRVGFTSTDPSIDVFNQNWFTAVNYKTGETPTTPFLDLNGDGVFDGNDNFTDIDDDGIVDPSDPLDTSPAVSRFLDTGVVSAPLPANIANNKDTVFISHGLEGIPDPPDPSAFVFNDPGLRGGHFDHDTSDEEGSRQRDHTHEYDDKYDIDGANPLNSGGSITVAGDVLTASGMLSGEKALKDNVEFLDETIRLRIRNPDTWDTPELFALRQLKGLEPEGSEPAGPVDIYYQCGGPAPWETEGHLASNAPPKVTAPEFNELPDSARECTLSNISYLKIKIPSINSLRASLPGCVRNDSLLNLPQSALRPLGMPALNDGYRDGALALQALRQDETGEWTVFWEDLIYEHITGASLDVDSIPNDPDNPNTERNGASSNCEALNEDLRAYKDPDYFNGDSNTTTETDPGEVTTGHVGGTQITETIDVTQFQLSDGRIIWREVLK